MFSDNNYKFGSKSDLKSVRDSYEKYIEKIDWNRLSYYSTVPPDFILENKDKPWDWFRLSVVGHPDMNLISLTHEKPWSWSSLSFSPGITFEFIQRFMHKPWNWGGVSNNRNDFTLKFLEDNLEYLTTFDPYKTTRDVQWQSYRPLSWEIISRCPKLTIEFVQKHIDKKWDWDYLSKAVSWEQIQTIGITLPWNWRILSNRPEIATLKRILKYPKYPWVLNPYETIHSFSPFYEGNCCSRLTLIRDLTTNLKHFRKYTRDKSKLTEFRLQFKLSIVE